jgi:hypothetical protein
MTFREAGALVGVAATGLGVAGRGVEEAGDSESQDAARIATRSSAGREKNRDSPLWGQSLLESEKGGLSHAETAPPELHELVNRRRSRR